MIRYDEPINLFYDHEITQPIEIKTYFHKKFVNNDDIAHISIKYNTLKPLAKGTIPIKEDNTIKLVKINGDYNVNAGAFNFSPFLLHALVKPFKFKVLDRFYGRNTEGLHPPLGDNLVMLLKTNKELRKNIASIFSRYGLKLAVKFSEKKIRASKRIRRYYYLIYI